MQSSFSGRGFRPVSDSPILPPFVSPGFLAFGRTIPFSPSFIPGARGGRGFFPGPRPIGSAKNAGEGRWSGRRAAGRHQGLDLFFLARPAWRRKQTPGLLQGDWLEENKEGGIVRTGRSGL